MKNRLKIEFRKKQLFLDQDPDQPVIVQCNLDGTAEYVPGTIAPNDWEDMTEFTEGLDDFNLSWSAVNEGAEGGDTVEGTDIGSNYQKGLSTNLRFFDTAFKFIEAWLMLNPCQALNAVEAKITDNDCLKSYRVFELKLDNTEYSPEESCIVGMPLREQDDTIHVFQKTIIEDNWQNWFNKDGASAKDHPTFGMIVERKPKFYLAIYVLLIYIAGMLSAGILVGLNEGKKWIRRTLGFMYFCPSPLIRTYIENICLKYGFSFNTMFDAGPYANTCLFWPASTSLKQFETFVSPGTKFIWDNRTVLSFSKFLNQLKKVFNAEWYVTPNKELVFQHKSYFDNQPDLYDFTAAGNDKIHGLKYSFNGKKKPAYGDYQYMVDPQDTCSNEVKWRYNAIVDFDGPANNPMLEGKVQKTFDFAMTAFHNDGSSEDFLEEGVELGRLIAIGAVMLGLGQLFLASNALTVAIVTGILAVGYAITNGYVNNFFNNAELNGIVRVSSSEINQPRLLIWDDTTLIDKAKVVSFVNPAVNPRYNTDPAHDYYDEHPTYESPGYFSLGGTVEKIYNYPMYVEEMFTGNLQDRFHEYDNPMSNPIINQMWEGSIDLCCEWLDRLGVWEGSFIRIGAVVTLENRQGRLIKGRITNIEPRYKDGAIRLQGNVLK